jgi:aminopeptidase N
MAGVLLLFALVCPSNGSAAKRIPQYDLHVSFDIANSKIVGLVKIAVFKGRPIFFHVGNLAIKNVEVNRQLIRHQVDDGRLRITPGMSGDLEIHYEGVFKAAASSPDTRDTNFAGVISHAGIFLTADWYPQIEGLAMYRLNAVLPLGYTAISEAEKVSKIEKDRRLIFTFDFKHPVDHINFIASDRYQVTEERFRDIDLSAYFFAEDQELVRTYLDYTKKYIQLYEKMLLPFPFRRFAIVENFLPTGYSMPTYTLLGQEVVRLPFIVETSLGHEILHQWFGNEVYVNPAGGNWAEGLTTYLADHFYAQQKGEGWQYRKQILIDYASYVHPDNDFPLNEFTQRFDGASRAIGYGKAALVFHMLRHRSTDDGFFDALRRFIKKNRFQQASWADLQSAFESQLGLPLHWFFEQWIEHAGLPELHGSKFAVDRSPSGRVLSFTLSQKGKIYRLDVPITITYKSGGEIKKWIRLDEKNKAVRIELAQEPSRVIIDPDYDLARKLSEPETPPVIASILGDEKLIVVPPSHNAPAYETIIRGLRSRGAQVRKAESLTHAEMESACLVLLGNGNAAIDKLAHPTKTSGHGFTITVEKNPLNPEKAIAMITTASAAEADAAFPKIFHYGKYSALAFDNGVNVHKTTAGSERGILVNAKRDPTAVDVSMLDRLSDVIEKLRSKKIIYVGESHSNFAHHEVQLQVLKGLHHQSPKIAIGMEMFERASQKALDDYIAGAIDERTFLKRSEYFKRWDMDYNLYKPILDYARSERIPVIALNLPREIVDKVGKDGLDSLTEEEKRAIPQHMDFSDTAYKSRLKDVFAAHSNTPDKIFEFFYQAQILWDETMAESVSRFLNNDPDFRMVVFTGSGHLEYGSGIPKRVYRRNGSSYAIVLNDADIQKGIADFIVFPEPVTAPKAPKLMVYLKIEDGKPQIAAFVQDSVSETAGLKVDDRIVALDGKPVNSIEDVKVALVFKHSGDTINVKIQRPGLFDGSTEMEFPVKLE